MQLHSNDDNNDKCNNNDKGPVPAADVRRVHGHADPPGNNTNSNNTSDTQQ